MLQCGVVVLAAGQGKRMKSSLPKVLHEVAGQPLIFHILDRVVEVLPGAPVAIVVGHGRELVESRVRENSAYSGLELTFVHQAEQKGTGHAARVAMDGAWGEARVKSKQSVLVLPGDLPLIPAELIKEMAESLGKSSVMRLLTCELADPSGYGRIVRRGSKGAVLRIAEEKDANQREKQIREVGASIYTFNPSFLRVGLQKLQNKNAQGEFYLTDLIAQAARAKKHIDVLKWPCAGDLRGVNDPWELSEAQRIMNLATIRKWAQAGVKFTDPHATWVDVHVKLAEEVTIAPGAILSGTTTVARGAMIGPHVVLKNVRVGEGAHIKAGTFGEDSAVGARANIGPYAHLRPESDVGADSKIGNFVELKKARIGAKTSIAHLSYVGDAEVGARVNIGCGFVTCNFDGRMIEGSRKHKTVIEDDVFIGSDCQCVAPVRVGRGAYVASGSTITEDVAPDSLAIARSRQVNKPGYAKKLRES